MKGKYEAPRRKSPVVLIIVLLILALAAGAVAWYLWNDKTPPQPDSGNTQPQTSSTPTESDPPTETTTEPETEPTTEPTEPEPVPLTVVSTATISSTGDILPHEGVRNSGLQSDGTYNYDSIWQYVTSYIGQADYAIANLETTLCGTTNGYKYSGYPQFNAPDALAVGALDAGFDMLLTANNHCNDTGEIGITRTVTTVREIGLDTLGTKPTAEEPDYAVVEVNGIRIGMMCYTYATTNSKGRPAINGISTNETSQYLVNTFTYSRLDEFYTEVSTHMAAMEAEGAEAYMMFIHWGNEYQLKPHENQVTIAQALCDLGIDVIVGGHPHVIQPIDLLTSTVDENHKTVCLYSMGNAVSNQRQGLIDACATAHTEDGMLFTVTFTKYSDGSVALTGTDILPCWVNRYNGSNGKRIYNILPLDESTKEEWATLYDLSENTYKAALRSYDRTIELTSEGLAECQTYLTESHTQRVEDYWNAQVNGELVVDPETTLPTMVTEPEEITEATDASEETFDETGETTDSGESTEPTEA